MVVAKSIGPGATIRWETGVTRGKQQFPHAIRAPPPLAVIRLNAGCATDGTEVGYAVSISFTSPINLIAWRVEPIITKSLIEYWEDSHAGKWRIAGFPKTGSAGQIQTLPFMW